MIAAADANRHDLSSLRQYLVGAAPVPASLIERCQAQGLAVYHCYGSSEHPTVTSGVVDDPLDKQPHTEGRATAGPEMRIVRHDRRDVQSGAAGATTGTNTVWGRGGRWGMI